MTPATLSQLSYHAAVRALDLQERAVEQLRARTGTLLAASSLTASFLGAQVIHHTNGLGIRGVLALTSLACSVGLCVYVLLPKEGFMFSINAALMYEELFELANDEGEVHRRLIYWLEGFRRHNDDKIGRLGRCFFVAAVALVLQLMFWTWTLIDMIS